MVAVKGSGFRPLSWTPIRDSPEWRELSLSCHSGASPRWKPGRNPDVLPLFIELIIKGITLWSWTQSWSPHCPNGSDVGFQSGKKQFF